MEETNDFMLLRAVVKEALNEYKNLRKRINWKDSGKSATIERLAKPFLEGYFTIAVAGKMSAGKSTFINSLIGENLLPTGHFQTTSGITWISSSEKRKMIVTFADGKIKEYDKNFKEELKGIVAVPKQYEELPINHINTLIIGGNNIHTILAKKAGIEKMTGTLSSESLWKKYVTETSKSKIATKVEIYIPLPKEYEGWRIVDTPGVGAIGGIQDTTKKLLTMRDGEDDNNIVDAVVLLHKGSENIQDEAAHRFAEDVRKSMGDLAKDRLFFILTHSSSSEFISNKEEILSKANTLFGNKLKIKKDKITYLDSFIQRLINDIKKSKKDFSSPVAIQIPLPGWEASEWESVKAILSPLYLQFMMDKRECSNSTLIKNLESLARFNEFRELLNEFLNNEKEATFNKLLNLIEGELNLYDETLRSNIQAVSNGQEGIDKAIEGIKKEDANLNLALVKVQQKVTPAAIKKAFEFVDKDLSVLSELQTITEVRTAYLQIIQKGLSAEQEFFKTLIKEFGKFANDFTNSDLTFRSIDFDDIEREAQKKATSKVTDYSRSEKKLVKEGGFSSDDQYETIYPHKKDKVDFDKKLREFKTLVIKEGRQHTKSYIEGIENKSAEFFTIVKSDIDNKSAENIKRLESYASQLDKQKELLNYMENDLKAIHLAQANLKKLSDD